MKVVIICQPEEEHRASVIQAFAKAYEPSTGTEIHIMDAEKRGMPDG